MNINKVDIENYYRYLSNNNNFPVDHVKYLYKLKESGFEPKTIYDIGSCVLHWTKIAHDVWPSAEIVLFDANPHCEFLYKDYKYHIGILSNVADHKKFYLNLGSPGGASYYREVGDRMSEKLYPDSQFVEMASTTLDSVVASKGFPLPDLVKMDIQGAEKDVIEGGKNTLSHARRLIVELPHVEYNKNAPSKESTIDLITSTGWTLTDPLFCDNGLYDGDYGFSK